MNPVTNPFAPGAGNQPPELAGRQNILDKASIAPPSPFSENKHFWDRL